MLTGLIGMALLAWAAANVVRSERHRPEVLQSPAGRLVSFVVGAIGIGLIYRGWFS